MKEILNKPIVLVGMMGSGKSTVGKKLASKMNLKFYDSDTVIGESTYGLNIREIVEYMGQDFLEEKEREVIKEILRYGPVVLSTGGSSFVNKEMRDYINEHAITIWLDVDFDTIYERVSRRNTRPELASGGNIKEMLLQLMKEREADFKEAHLKIKSELEAHLLVGTIIKRLKEHLQQTQ